MPTSQEASTFLNDVLSAEVIPEGKMAYFRGRLANRFHALVLSEFARLEAAGKINGAKLARRISREPAQISRWLGSAGNWTFDTLSDLLLGMGYEPDLSVIDLRAEGKHIQDAEGLAHISWADLNAANDALGTYHRAPQVEQPKPSITVQAA